MHWGPTTNEPNDLKRCFKDRNEDKEVVGFVCGRTDPGRSGNRTTRSRKNSGSTVELVVEETFRRNWGSGGKVFHGTQM